MSVAAMSAVFDADLSPPIKLVVLALADYADAYGQACFPSVDSICRRTGYTRRQVQRSLRAATDVGVIVRVGISPLGTTEYRIVLPALAERPSLKPSKAKQCPRTLRAEVIAAFRQRCQYCHQPGTDVFGPDGASWNIDRILPGSRGGEYIPSNITLSCGSCNKRKRDREASAPNLEDVRGRQDDTPEGRQEEPKGAPNGADDGSRIEHHRGAKMAPKPTTQPNTQPPAEASAQPAQPETDPAMRTEADLYYRHCTIVLNETMPENPTLEGGWIPITASQQIGRVTWMEDGIPLDVVGQVIRERCLSYHSTRENRGPRSIKYFDRAVREQWERGRMTQAEDRVIEAFK